VTEPLREFVRLVNEGAYWESHEILEAPWRDRGSDFYQGLILYASAFVHVDRGNPHGIRAQLRKALERLSPYPETYLGVDVEGIRRHARKVRETVGALEDASPERWWSVIERPHLSLAPEDVRGTEPELQGG